MSRACSVFARRVYGKILVCRHWGVARSTHYARRAALANPSPATARCGRPPVIADSDLVVQSRAVLRDAEGLGWRGAGYRKVWARLRHRGIPTSRERVRRLLRLHGLQAPHRAGKPRGPRHHDGTIIPEAPNRLWGTDATQAATRLEGTATIFVAIDPFMGDIVGMHAARLVRALMPWSQYIRDCKSSSAH